MELISEAGKLSGSIQAAAQLLMIRGLPKNEEDPAGRPEMEEEIPWSSIYHKAREVMGLTNDEFWSMSPQKYFAILEESLVYHGVKESEKQEFMDDLF